MNDPLASLPLDRPVTLQFADGVVLRATLRGAGGGWVVVEDARGRHWVQLAHVVMLSAVVDGAPAPAVDQERPRPKPVPGPSQGGRAPGRPWGDDDLKVLADAFLEGATDSDCADRFNRTRHQITLLRQGFEAARGGLDEDRIPAVAQTWVARWRRLLAG